MFKSKCWIMDSGAFTEVSKHGGYRHSPNEYATEIRRWARHDGLVAAVTQDFMCEPFILTLTGKTVREHQQLTIERYDALVKCGTDGVYLMPVLQGYSPKEYVEHCYLYGDRLQQGAWVGVGSICKRSGSPKIIAEILGEIKKVRPDLELHGFGLKITALSDALVRELLTTADSMAWSFAARRQGRGTDANRWEEAAAFVQRIEAKIWLTLR